MMNILDHVAESAARNRSAGFYPTTTKEYFALQLATKLDDGCSARHYAELADTYSEGHMLAAYRLALKSHVGTARRFHVELESLRSGRGDVGRDSCVIAVRIERRAVAIAILRGDHLHYADSRQLSSVQNKAIDSAAGFVTRMIERFRCDYAALEIVPNDHEVQRTLLHQAILRVLNVQAIGITEVEKSGLLRSFAYPAPRFRSTVREIISNVYPVLNEAPGQPWVYDAAALGLYVQTERLFNSINQSRL